MASPAEDHAAEHGLPVVAVIVQDLFRAATGNPIIVSTVDGGRVLLRLMTPDELIAAQVTALESVPPDLRPLLMTRDRAVELTAPLRVAGEVTE